MSWATLLTILEVAWIVALSLGIVLERRSPTATLAWIGALVWLPFVGALVYYLLGPRRLKRRKVRRQECAQALRRAMQELDREVDDPRWSGLARLAITLGESPPLPAHDVRLFLDGDALYDALEAAIREARHHVHVEYYIFDDDAIGRRMIAALTERAAAGVEVRVVLDGIGSYGLADRAFDALRASGGDVAWFNPVSGLRPRLANFRTHRKIVIVDGSVAFTGGMNVAGDHSIHRSGGHAWRDTHLAFRGPATRALQRVFLEDWIFASGKTVPPREPYFVPVTRDGAHTLLQVVSSGPDRDVFPIYQVFFTAIMQARERIWLTTPYFVPDEPMLTALVAAGLRGVDVRILVPRSSDNLLVDLAARSYYPELVRARVHIYEYVGRMLHAKTLVVDGELAIVGTANFDNRSFRLNFEVIAALYDPQMAAELAHAFERDLTRAELVRVREIKEKRFIDRLGEATARLFSPLL